MTARSERDDPPIYWDSYSVSDQPWKRQVRQKIPQVFKTIFALFFTIKKNNGRESHHFQCWLFRFDRRKVKPSVAGYFYCSERTCKAAIRVNYVEENEEPSDIHVTNSNHNHQPDIAMNYVVCICVIFYRNT